jgi:UDP-N-acetyl-D-glucosamine dehydrogenase
VLESARAIGEVLRPGQLIILESTTYPRTTKDEFLPAILQAAGDADRREFVVGKNLFVAFSPEREDPGRKSHSTTTIPKLVGGVDPTSTDLAAAVYECGVDTVVKVASAEIAEAAKILENVFRSVNIAMVNELKMLFDEMDIDVWEVIKAASTKPFGFMPFYPGPGLGGHCIPIDPYYLTWKAREHNKVTRFIELAGEINRQMPGYVLSRIASALNDDKKSVNGSNILVIGLAYKPDIDDTRETPAAELIKIIATAGGVVSYHDPHVPVFPPMRNYSFVMESVELDKNTLEAADCVVIVTNHDVIDYDLIGTHSKLVVDTRNAMESVASPKARIVKA